MGTLMTKTVKAAMAVLMRQLRGLGHQPPAGDQTHLG